MKDIKPISVISPQTSKEKFYSSYGEALRNARSGDKVIVYASLNEQIFMKSGIRLIFNKGVIIERAEDSPPFIIFCGNNEDNSFSYVEGLVINIT